MAGKASRLTFQNVSFCNDWPTVGCRVSLKTTTVSWLMKKINGVFVKEIQDDQWQKLSKLYPSNPDHKFLERIANQLNKASLKGKREDLTLWIP